METDVLRVLWNFAVVERSGSDAQIRPRTQYGLFVFCFLEKCGMHKTARIIRENSER